MQVSLVRVKKHFFCLRRFQSPCQVYAWTALEEVHGVELKLALPLRYVLEAVLGPEGNEHGRQRTRKARLLKLGSSWI